MTAELNKQARRIYTAINQEVQRPLNFKLCLMRLSPVERATLEKLIGMCEATSNKCTNGN